MTGRHMSPVPRKSPVCDRRASGGGGGIGVEGEGEGVCGGGDLSQGVSLSCSVLEHRAVEHPRVGAEGGEGEGRRGRRGSALLLVIPALTLAHSATDAIAQMWLRAQVDVARSVEAVGWRAGEAGRPQHVRQRLLIVAPVAAGVLEAAGGAAAVARRLCALALAAAGGSGHEASNVRALVLPPDKVLEALACGAPRLLEQLEAQESLRSGDALASTLKHVRDGMLPTFTYNTSLVPRDVGADAGGGGGGGGGAAAAAAAGAVECVLSYQLLTAGTSSWVPPKQTATATGALLRPLQAEAGEATHTHTHTHTHSDEAPAFQELEQGVAWAAGSASVSPLVSKYSAGALVRRLWSHSLRDIAVAGAEGGGGGGAIAAGGSVDARAVQSECLIRGGVGLLGLCVDRVESVWRLANAALTQAEETSGPYCHLPHLRLPAGVTASERERELRVLSRAMLPLSSFVTEQLGADVTRDKPDDPREILERAASVCLALLQLCQAHPLPGSPRGGAGVEVATDSISLFAVAAANIDALARRLLVLSLLA